MKATFAFLVMTIAIINVLGYASAQEADTTPPTVVKVYPPNGATDVKPGVTTISVTFSEEMMGGCSWMVMGDKGSFPPRVEGPWYDEAHITCSMSVLLLPGTTYAIGINYPEGGGNFKDKSGNPAVSFEDWVFTTSGTKEEIPAFLAKMVEDKDSNVRKVAARELKRLTDTTPPTVVQVSPPNGATDVKPGITTISVTFSEEMMDGSWSWWDLSDLGEGPFPSKITGPRYDESHTTCSMTVLLSPGTTYAIGINSPEGIGNFKDVIGKPAVFYKWVFTTSGTKEDTPEFLAEMLKNGGNSDVRKTAVEELMRLEYRAAIDVVTKALHSINVLVDPRIKLLAVVQYLSGYGERFGLITRYDMPYKHDVMGYFAPFKEHLAVKLFAEMSADNFSFDAPPTAMLHLSEPPDLSLEVPFTDYLKKRAGGEERLEEFVKALRDFARETQFMAFFEAHKGTFLQTVFDAHENLRDIDYIGTLENYFGMKQHSYNIILAPLFHDGGFGPRIERTDGACDIYNIRGPSGVENGFPNFGTVEGFRYFAWHEFSHSFVNPTTERFAEQIVQYNSLYEPISESMKRQAYGDWLTCVNEHIVRAVTTRLAYQELGREAGEEALKNEKRKSFVYVEALCKRLEQYENQRDKYPTFVDFYPELITVFKELSEKELGDDFYSIPFTGTINAVSDDKKSVILIIPTRENDKAVQDKIHAYVKEIHDKFFKDSPILTDEEALKRDLSANALIVYGTTTGNLWLAQHIAELPIRVESDKIVADTVYSGVHLRFISAWPNPQNPQKGVVIYTAQQAEDVIGINSVFHGPTDYVIAKDTEILKAADYKKKDESGVWTIASKDISGEMLSLEDRLKDLNALCDAIERIHPSLEYKGVNIELLRKEFEERVKHAKGDDKFYNLLEELLERIHDSHTRLVSIPGKEGSAIPPTPKIEELISYRWLENEIGYIKIRVFWGGMEEEGNEMFVNRFDEALEEFKESRALVIDVRGNPGGNGDLADAINGRFVKEPVVSSIDFWREEGTDKYRKGIGLVRPRGPWTYEKPVAVLIDGSCASSCEHFVSGAEATGRMLLVGTPTAGAGGGPTQITLPSGAVVNISRAISIRVCGIVCEGHGIPPHIEVRPNSEDVKAGVDPVLEEALKAIEEWIKKGEISLPQRSQVIVPPPSRWQSAEGQD